MAELSYRTYDELISSVAGDLSLYDSENLIKPLRYIKTAKTCNATLGLKLNQQKEATIDVENFIGDLPDDLLTILLLAKDCKNYSSLIKPMSSSLSKFSERSPNRNNCRSGYEVSVEDNQMVFNFECGTVYIYYLSQMVDEAGNLLILDHDLTNDYYEWALKEKIFQDIWHNNDADVQQKLGDARQQVIIARSKAKSIVRTPEWRKLREQQQKVETEFYNRYVKMFNI